MRSTPKKRIELGSGRGIRARRVDANGCYESGPQYEPIEIGCFDQAHSQSTSSPGEHPQLMPLL